MLGDCSWPLSCWISACLAWIRSPRVFLSASSSENSLCPRAVVSMIRSGTSMPTLGAASWAARERPRPGRARYEGVALELQSTGPIPARRVFQKVVPMLNWKAVLGGVEVVRVQLPGPDEPERRGTDGEEEPEFDAGAPAQGMGEDLSALGPRLGPYRRRAPSGIHQQS